MCGKKWLPLIVVGLIGVSGCRTTASNSATNCCEPQGRSCVTTPCGSHYEYSASTRKRAPFAILGPTFSDSRLWEGTAPLPWQYAYNVCLSGSQMVNTVLGGDPDESLSSRLGRAEQDGVAVVKYGVAPVTDVLLGTHHCQESIEASESRLQEVWAW